MSLCQFAPTSKPHEYRCEVCGGTYRDKLDRPRNRPCRPEGAMTQAATPKPCGNCGEPGMPGALRTLWNFTKATARWAANGARAASKEQYEARKAICEGCPRLVGGTRCAECGCYVSWKAARIEKPMESDCPLGRWPAG